MTLETAAHLLKRTQRFLCDSFREPHLFYSSITELHFMCYPLMSSERPHQSTSERWNKRDA